MVYSRPFRNRLHILVSLVTAVASVETFAGSIDNRSNHSAAYIRHLNRAAVTDATDAAAFNPAGLTHMGEGLFITLDNQFLDKYNRASSDQGFDFTSDVFSLLLPTASVVWSHGDWAAFLNSAIIGGGGNVHYPTGTPTVLPLVAALALEGTAPDVQLSSVAQGTTLGVSYAFHPKISASIAGRLIYGINNVQVKARGETLFDHEETALYPTVVFGLHFSPTDYLDIGLRYENIGKLDYTVDKSEFKKPASMPQPAADNFENMLRGVLKAEGTEFPHDLPPVAALGLGLKVNPKFRIDASAIWYGNTVADWETLDDEVDDGYELGLGVEVKPIEKWTFSAGYLHTWNGANADTYRIESPALDGYTLGTGFRWQAHPRLAFDAAYAYTGTFDGTANFSGLEVDLEKHVHVYAMGFTYQAF